MGKADRSVLRFFWMGIWRRVHQRWKLRSRNWPLSWFRNVSWWGDCGGKGCCVMSIFYSVAEEERRLTNAASMEPAPKGM